jgi:hypothetical protein
MSNSDIVTKLPQVVALPNFIWNAFVTNLDGKIDYPEDFRGFSQSLQAKAWLIPQKRPTVLPFDAI